MYFITLLTVASLAQADSQAYANAPAAPKPADQAIESKFLKKQKLKVGKIIITAEIADSDESRTRGLMFRQELAPNSGMLFVFSSEQPLAFWMKNTLIPLSIGYFDANKRLIDIQEMQPMLLAEQKPRTYPSKGPAQYALEMPENWFKKNGIRLGDKFSFIGSAAK